MIMIGPWAAKIGFCRNSPAIAARVESRTSSSPLTTWGNPFPGAPSPRLRNFAPRATSAVLRVVARGSGDGWFSRQVGGCLISRFWLGVSVCEG